MMGIRRSKATADNDNNDELSTLAICSQGRGAQRSDGREWSSESSLVWSGWQEWNSTQQQNEAAVLKEKPGNLASKFRT
jgi:hypothetical protein